MSQLMHAFFSITPLLLVPSSIPLPKIWVVMAGVLVAILDHKVPLRMGIKGQNDLGENENELQSRAPLVILALKFLSLEHGFHIGEKQWSLFMSLFGKVSVTYSGINTKRHNLTAIFPSLPYILSCQEGRVLEKLMPIYFLENYTKLEFITEHHSLQQLI